MEDASKCDYELVIADEYPVLFTNARLDRNSVPKGLFRYDVRHDDDCQGIACEIKNHVLVNHWGLSSVRMKYLWKEGVTYQRKNSIISVLI